MVSRCLSVTRLPSLSFALRASNPRLLAVALPCILQRNCQRSVVSFQTLPETTAKALIQPKPIQPLQAVVTALKALASSRRKKPGWRKSSHSLQPSRFGVFRQCLVRWGSFNIHCKTTTPTRFYTEMATTRWLWAGRFDTATRLHRCVPYTTAKPQ
jgi:hypothetical protein